MPHEKSAPPLYPMSYSGFSVCGMKRSFRFRPSAARRVPPAEIAGINAKEASL